MYFCRRSLTTWDVLLPSEEILQKLAENNITAKFFRLQPEYRGQRQIKVTVCNVSMQISGDVFAVYLSAYGGVEHITQIISTSETAYGNYSFNLCLDRGGFQTIPHTITYRDKTMMLFVEGVVFWPSTRPKMPFKVMHWKQVTHSNGSYERKSRGRKFANKMGQAKKSHDTLIDWRTGREWPLNCMTVISAWWRLNMRCQTSRGRSSGRWTIT